MRTQQEKLELADKHIANICMEMNYFLQQKNKSYGNSAFSDTFLGGNTLTAEQSILVRMSDKIKRLTQGTKYQDEDTFKDLLGYLIIYFANKEYQKEVNDTPFKAQWIFGKVKKTQGETVSTDPVQTC